MSVPSTGAPTIASFFAVNTWRESFDLLTRNAGTLFLLILALYAAAFAAGSIVGFLAGLIGRSQSVEGVASAVGLLISFALTMNIWIGVSRLAVRGERLLFGALFDWRGRQWRMLGATLLCLIIALAPLLIILIIGSTFFAGVETRRSSESLVLLMLPGLAVWVMLLFGFVWAVTFGVRLGFVYPIVANDGPPGSLRQSWELSRGQTFKLIGGVVLIALPIVLVELLLLLPALFLLGALREGLYATLAQSFGGSIAGIWVMAFFSIAYRKLAGPKAA